MPARTVRSDPLPSGVPVLAAGAHLGPADGACLMEAAAWLAGERWSDHPRCVHPSLAAVARVVNDASSPAGRSCLARLLPQLIGVRGIQARVAPVLVLTCVQAAERAGPLSVRLRLCARRARRRLQRLDRAGVGAWWCRAGDIAYRNAPADRAVTQAITHIVALDSIAQGSERDRVLAELLERCRDAAASLLSAPPACSGVLDAGRPVLTASGRGSAGRLGPPRGRRRCQWVP